MPSSDSSSLSSGLSDVSDNDLSSPNSIAGGSLDHYFKQGSKPASPPQAKRKRPVSPPHEYVLADNADIAFIVMFRSRFSAAFPKSLPHYGPQDIERGIADSLPDEQVEKLLCALLGLVLNRKKDVERGHYQRALEEAVQSHTSQWPLIWNGKNPLHGGGNFNNMGPEQRLALLKALIIWSLSSSEAIQAILKESYKQQRHDDDLNQPLSVQPWGRDGDKRRYWLIEGQDDTHFRLYRESNPVLKNNTWRALAGSIDELKLVADRLEEEGSQASRRLKERIVLAVPRFEASEEKRKRRDYRNSRKAQFTRPEPGFSLYEGRTRGKRIRYNYSDEEEVGSDAVSTKRSNRPSGVSTPAEPAGPTFTASGRQVRSRVGGTYGETVLSGKQEQHHQTYGGDGTKDDGDQPLPRTRTRGSAPHNPTNNRSRKHIEGYNALDDMDDESDATSSGVGWDGGDDEDVDGHIAEDEDEEDVDMSDTGDSAEEADYDQVEKRSLLVTLKYRKTPRNQGAENLSKYHGPNGVNGFSDVSTPSIEIANQSPYQDCDVQKGINGHRFTASHDISPSFISLEASLTQAPSTTLSTGSLFPQTS